MRVHIVQHAAFETPGALLDWAFKFKHEVTILKPAKGDRLPIPADTDFLVLLGGPMSVHDEAEHPWMAVEKLALKTFIQLDQKPLLGICFGAQMIADVLGAQVFQNDRMEIGWFRTQFHKTGVFKNMKDLTLMLFHWHGEIFNLPAGATLLAESKVTPVQGFQYGKRTLALQFHPEINSVSLKSLLAELEDTIRTGDKTRQNATEIRHISKDHLKKSAEFLEELLQSWTSSR